MSSSLGKRVGRSRSLITGESWNHSQDDVNVLRVACWVLRQEFIQIGNADISRIDHYSVAV